MALKLNLKEEKATWVDYEVFDENGNKIADAKFLLKPLSMSEMDKISKQATIRVKKPVIDKGRKRFEIVEELDYSKFVKLMFDAICKDWEGIEDENGNKIECTKENKEIIADNYIGIANFCIEEANKISEMLAQKTEEEIKN